MFTCLLVYTVVTCTSPHPPLLVSPLSPATVHLAPPYAHFPPPSYLSPPPHLTYIPFPPLLPHTSPIHITHFQDYYYYLYRST